MADSIKVTLTPSTIEARPSTPAVMVVTIHNTGQTVEQYSIEIEGLSSSWYSLPETRVALFPNDRDDVRITILPSLEAGMAAGSHSFTITVVAQANPAERATANGIIKVAAATALEAQLRPSRATGRKARYRVLLRNAGNSAVDVDLDATDSEEGCDFAFKPAMVSIEPGRKVEIGVRVRPVHPRLVGTEHSFDFRVMVQPNLGEARPLQGHFIYKPRFRSWRPFTRLVSLVALVVIAIVAAPFILMQARKAAQVINVQPNVAMGSVKLGATNPDSIMAAMGAGAIMTNHETLITQPQKAGIMTAHLRQGQVVSMLTTSPAFSMTGGVHVGSPVSAVQKAFGNSVAVIGQNAVAASTMGNGGLTPVATVGTTVMPAKALAGGALVVVGKNTMDGGHAMTFFDLNKTGTKVVAVRMGYYPWITADHGGPTQVKAITSTTTWGITGGPYIVTGNVRIPKGVALTISPGVHVFFTDVNSSLKVDGGMLSAVGTANAPVVFTSIRDPKHGAIDTLMRPAPQPGDWGSLGVTAAGGTLQLANTQIYFGGSSAKNGNAELNIDGTGNPNVSIQNSDIAGAKGYGLNAATAPVGTQIQGNTFAANEFPMLIGGGISVDNSNVFTSKADPPNKHNAVYVTPSATIAANGATVVWSLRGVPFILQAKELVASGGTLELGPGVILKGIDAQSRLSVSDGSLIVAGQRQLPVIMTSYHDDTHGGDTDADGGVTAPSPGDWRGLILKGKTTSVIRRLSILYGGATAHPALGIQDHASVEIRNSEIGNSATDGILNVSDQPVAIMNTSFHDNAKFGIDVGPNAANMTTVGGNKSVMNGIGDLAISGTPVPTPGTGATATPPPPTPNTGMTMPADIGMPTMMPTTMPAVTDTPTPGATVSATAVATDTPPPSVTAAPVASDTATPAAIDTPTLVTMDTPTPSVTDTPSPTGTDTPTPSATATTSPAIEATPSETPTVAGSQG